MLQTSNNKLLLAEALDILRNASNAETTLDAYLAKMREQKNTHIDSIFIIGKYANIYENYITGLKELNHIRHISRDKILLKFCTDTMLTWMIRCEMVRNKETDILIPIEKAVVNEDSTRRVSSTCEEDDKNICQGRNSVVVQKPGHEFSSLIYLYDSRGQLSPNKTPICFDQNLTSGSYQFTVVNLQNLSLTSSSEITVELQTVAASTRALVSYKKVVPPGLAWCKFIGVGSGEINLKFSVTSNAWMRKSLVLVELIRLELINNQPFAKCNKDTLDKNKNRLVKSIPQTLTSSLSPQTIAPPLSLPLVQNPASFLNSLPPISAISGESKPNVGASEKLQTIKDLDHNTITINYKENLSKEKDEEIEECVIKVAPQNKTIEERLEIIQKIRENWQTEAPINYTFEDFNKTESEKNKELLSAILALTDPTPLSD